MHTHGVSRPEGVKLRIVKASGRTLGETKFHMEIRTLRPGQASAAYCTLLRCIFFFSFLVRVFRFSFVCAYLFFSFFWLFFFLFRFFFFLLFKACHGDTERGFYHSKHNGIPYCLLTQIFSCFFTAPSVTVELTCRPSVIAEAAHLPKNTKSRRTLF